MTTGGGGVAPDPYLDQLIADLCGADPERQHLAWSAAVRILQETPERIAGDLCDVVDHFLESETDGTKAGATLFVLSNNTARAPDLVPFDSLERWMATPERFDRVGFLAILTMASRLRPDRVVERCLSQALEVSPEAGLASAELWLNVGVAYPEVVLGIAASWFERAEWDTKFGGCLVRVFTELAHARPEQLDAMIAIVRAAAARETPLEPGTIRLRLDNTSSPAQVVAALEKLRAA